MKLVSKLTLINLFCFTTFAALADDITNQTNQQINTNTATISRYLQYLGGYLGYNLNQSPTANNQNISQQLLSLPTTQLAESYVYSTFFGALPVAAIGSSFSQIVPSTVSGSNVINKLANATFTYQGYSSASGAQQGTISVSNLIDQQTFQQDPVSQAVLNILGTPDYSYCMSYDQSTWNSKCNYLYENLVMSNVLGTLPTSSEFFSYDYNQQLIPQLNA